jgi:site-specific DNA-methyltransferase (adenine-specific)
LAKLKHPPIVTELCVQYVKQAEFEVGEESLSLKEWLRHEWMRTGLPLYKTNEACGVANAASRKYFTKCHLWYAPPAEHFEKLTAYANQYGRWDGKPYFSRHGKQVMSKPEYEQLFAKFRGKYGYTNVWDHPPLHTKERIRINGSKKYAHLNQKPIKLIKYLIETSTDVGDVIWEPFGGLCTAGYVARQTKRQALCAEIEPKIFKMAQQRLESNSHNIFTTQKVIQYAVI